MRKQALKALAAMFWQFARIYLLAVSLFGFRRDVRKGVKWCMEWCANNGTRIKRNMYKELIKG